MKVFGIGLSRTGTTSLAGALGILGYNAKHYPLSKGDFDTFEALTDTPIAWRYKLLDGRYPGSKFILTVRDLPQWLKSCERFFLNKEPNMWDQLNRMMCYGTVTFDKDRFAAAYQSHLTGVQAYFVNRPNDLLILKITCGDGWEKLCPFLDRACRKTPLRGTESIFACLFPLDRSCFFGPVRPAAWSPHLSARLRSRISLFRL